MGSLTFEVKQFIENNIDLIENGAWDEIYDNAMFDLDSQSTGDFTTAMLRIGLNPVHDGNLDYLPEYYLSDQSIDTYIIDESIGELCEGCFSYSKIKKIIIPETVTSIGPYAFYDCLDLKEVTILSKNLSIGHSVFNYFPSNLTFRCYKNSPVANWLLHEINSADGDSVLEYLDD